MIGLLVLGLLGCGWGDLKRGQVVTIDDLTWPNDADKRLFVDLAAYYDQTFPAWTTGPFRIDQTGRAGRVWCAPEIPAALCEGRAVFDLASPESLAGASANARGVGMDGPGSWIWLSGAMPDLHAKTISDLNLMFVQPVSVDEPHVSGELLIDAPDWRESSVLSVRWWRTAASFPLVLDLSAESTSTSLLTARQEALRHVFGSTGDLRTLVETQAKGRGDHEAPDEQVLQRTSEMIRVEAGAIQRDLGRFLPVTVLLAP